MYTTAHMIDGLYGGKKKHYVKYWAQTEFITLGKWESGTIHVGVKLEYLRFQMLKAQK